jgi:histidine ammonia-lyase
VSQNKQLATPSSDSIVSSNGQEDHVGEQTELQKHYRVMDNIERILAIELMNAAQAIQYRDH